MKSILPDWLYQLIIKNYNLDDVQELRIRRNQPIQICYKGKMIELKSDAGLYLKPILANQELIDYVVTLLTKQSLYAFEDQIKNGYIVTENGIRVGVCGTAVTSNDKINFIKNISSLNIRIGHNIRGCSDEIINYLISNNCVKNTLIISPPGAGKTTMLRDIICKLSNDFCIPNIMVVDEKFELSGENNRFNLGKNVDVFQAANKNFAFYNAIKVMNPSVIVTDEIVNEKDLEGVQFAIGSGVNVIASVHSKSIDDLKAKPNLEKIFKDKLFDRFVVLSKRNGVGTVEGVFDENSFALYLPYLKWKLYCFL